MNYLKFIVSYQVEALIRKKRDNSKQPLPIEVLPTATSLPQNRQLGVILYLA